MLSPRRPAPTWPAPTWCLNHLGRGAIPATPVKGGSAWAWQWVSTTSGEVLSPRHECKPSRVGPQESQPPRERCYPRDLGGIRLVSDQPEVSTTSGEVLSPRQGELAARLTLVVLVSTTSGEVLSPRLGHTWYASMLSFMSQPPRERCYPRDPKQESLSKRPIVSTTSGEVLSPRRKPRGGKPRGG